MRIEIARGFFAASIGTVISALEQCDLAARVEFSFCGAVPTKMHSYRGYYEHLALGWSVDDEAPTVKEVIETLRGAIGRTFGGYKGGAYLMSKDTPLWVDQHDRSSGTGIVAVESDEDCCVLVTMKVA